LPKSNRKVFYKLPTVASLLIFLITGLKFSLLANAFPVNLDCENYVCDCYRTSDTTSLDINKIIVSIDEGSITDSVLIACCYHQIALEYYYEYNDDLSSLKYNKKTREIRERHNDGLLWRTRLNIGINY